MAIFVYTQSPQKQTKNPGIFAIWATKANSCLEFCQGNDSDKFHNSFALVRNSNHFKILTLSSERPYHLTYQEQA